MAFFEYDGWIEDGLEVGAVGEKVETFHVKWNTNVSFESYLGIAIQEMQSGKGEYVESWGHPAVYNYGEMKLEEFRGVEALTNAKEFYAQKLVEVKAEYEEVKKAREAKEAAELAKREKEEEERKKAIEKMVAENKKKEAKEALEAIQEYVDISKERALRPGEDNNYWRLVSKIREGGMEAPELYTPPAQILEGRFECSTEYEEDEKFFAILKECCLSEEDFEETDLGLSYSSPELKVVFEFLEPFGFDVKIESESWFGQFAKGRMGVKEVK